MTRRIVRALLLAATALLGVACVATAIAVPMALLLSVDDKTLARWSNVGQAMSPVGIFFSGLAFIGIAITLALQGRQLRNQAEELRITREEQQQSNEVALRQLHTDLVKMAISDAELLEVWPQVEPGIGETRKDHYCNLILNLQKVAYEAGTIELEELRDALSHLMTSLDIRAFWSKARTARVAVTGSDKAEDFFTREVDQAFESVRSTSGRPDSSSVASRVTIWSASAPGRAFRWVVRQLKSRRSRC